MPHFYADDTVKCPSCGHNQFNEIRRLFLLADPPMDARDAIKQKAPAQYEMWIYQCAKCGTELKRGN